MTRTVLRSAVGRKGEVLLAVYCERPGNLVASGDEFAFYDRTRRSPRVLRGAWSKRAGEWLDDRRFKEYGNVALVRHHNAYVNTGLNNALDREFGLGGTAIGFIGVSNNTTAVTASSVNLNGASGGTAANTIILAISPAATRTAQTTTGGATFVNASFTSGVFVINKVGFLTTSTDAGTGLVDVIGGTGGVAPYNRTFVLDLTGAGTFSFTGQIAVQAVAV